MNWSSSGHLSSLQVAHRGLCLYRLFIKDCLLFWRPICMLQVTRFLVYLHQPGKWGKLSVPWLWYVSRWDHFWCDKSLYKIPGNCPSATCTTSYIMYSLLWIMAAQTGRCTFFVDIAYHFQKKWPSIVLLQSKYADILLKFGLLGQSHLKLSIFTPK